MTNAYRLTQEQAAEFKQCSYDDQDFEGTQWGKVLGKGNKKKAKKRTSQMESSYSEDTESAEFGLLGAMGAGAGIGMGGAVAYNVGKLASTPYTEAEKARLQSPDATMDEGSRIGEARAKRAEVINPLPYALAGAGLGGLAAVGYSRGRGRFNKENNNMANFNKRKFVHNLNNEAQFSVYTGALVGGIAGGVGGGLYGMKRAEDRARQRREEGYDDGSWSNVGRHQVYGGIGQNVGVLGGAVAGGLLGGIASGGRAYPKSFYRNGLVR